MLANTRLMRRTAFVSFALIAGCDGSQPSPPPQPQLSFDGLPVRGSLADARKAGFKRCFELTTGLRCRKENVMLKGQGPYSSAVDLKGRDGRGGIGELSLWHDSDQNALFAVGDELERDGWTACLTGDGDRSGDQKIWTRAGAPVRLSMDISYWGKRRLRVIPQSGKNERGC